ncbi:hypothetical protein DL95DRAFT_414337 [Leptodontidium sp. 2 PMI_412]|nr:hypothetical protein DL95DRAFT_414337 [Leptodontidium sp. 2 PMI_412]
MLGKLGMTVDECIAAYEQLASDIFGKKHLRARFTRGLAPARYSASGMVDRIGALLETKELRENLRMHSPSHEDNIACAVICREHQNSSRYSDLLSDAVCICSLQCPTGFDCSVCEAARATSAAPTFFAVQRIGDRYFSDGGMEFNNPSYEIWCHYSQCISVAESRRRSATTEIEDCPGHPGGLDFSEVRFVNLGTGDEPPPDRQSTSNKFAILIPAPIRMIVSLKNKLKKMAVSAQGTANVMRGLATVAGGRFSIQYDRFSADNGVCFIKMDKYRKIPELKVLTSQYLRTPTTQRRLRRLAASIAADYLARQRDRQARPTSDLLSVPQHNANAGRPQVSHSASSSRNAASTDTERSLGVSGAESIVGNTHSRQPSTEVTTPASRSTPGSSPPGTFCDGTDTSPDKNI